MEKATYDYYTEPSNSYQWQEKQSARQSWQEKHSRFGPKIWSKSDIDEFRIVLAKSYYCNASDINYNFTKVDADDEEYKDKCINLNFTMKCLTEGQLNDRVIYSIKTLVPEEILQKYRMVKQQQSVPQSHVIPPITPIKPKIN